MVVCSNGKCTREARIGFKQCQICSDLKAKYDKSAAGKAKQARYEKGAAGKATQARYRSTEKGRLNNLKRQLKHSKTPLGKACQKRYCDSGRREELKRLKFQSEHPELYESSE